MYNEQMPSSAMPAIGRVVAVVLCAGQGTRMGVAQNKVFLPLGGQPLLAYALGIFERSTAVDELMLVAHPIELSRCREIAIAAHVTKLSAVIPGGASRHQSEECALNYLRQRIAEGEVGVVLIHDGARPFISGEAVHQLVTLARSGRAAMLAAPLLPDEVLLRRGTDNLALAVTDLHQLMRAQTPQACEARTLLAAYDAARAEGFEGTDTAASLERAGCPVAVVPGPPTNIKVTTPDDLLRAEALLQT